MPQAGFVRKGGPWAIGTLLLVIVVIVLNVVTSSASSRPSNAPGVDASDITWGSATAEVVLVEYSDFQCEYCAEYSATLAELREKYKDRVLFVFRFFPLDNHPYGMIAAQAAYAARLQDRFWEMHDLLFENQQEWAEADDPLPYFATYAAQLGLDPVRFEEDLVTPSTVEFVTKQVMQGEQAGVEHTPWFILNQSVVIPSSPKQMEALIEAAL